ncbi:MAG TPA: inositol monophosphatase family protein [Ignavibacteriaceae bacterium]|nr:inositol monophosphatase family protein [Ignavibacteriaceae bacterium]
MINDLIQISREAGEIIREKFHKNFKIDYKSNEKDLVTEVDKLSEKHITDFIKRKYPSHGILAEESGNIKEGREYLWVIDPLDGTVNFAHGLPVFSISIGLRKNKETIAGVVYDIMQNIIYSAEKGKGAFAGSQKIEVTENDNLGHALLVTGFPYGISANPDNALGKFASLTRAARGIRRLGSAAIDLCYVARGVFDGFWEVYLNPWDMCAGKLIVEEAGGLVTDFDGNEMDIYSKRILATNGKIHQSMIEILKKN